jgi:transcriptional regulator with XRE-family HTH domain
MSGDALASLGDAVRAMREEQLLSLDDLALAAAVDPARLAALERGRLDPDFELLLRLADAMSTRASVFVVEAKRYRGAAPNPARSLTNRQADL